MPYRHLSHIEEYEVYENLTNVISNLGYKHGFEYLYKAGIIKDEGRNGIESLDTDWKKMVDLNGHTSTVDLVIRTIPQKPASDAGV